MGMAQPYVRVRIKGELGNQLFQAAAATAIAHRIGGHVQLAPHNYDAANSRAFDLPALLPDAHVARMRGFMLKPVARVALDLGRRVFPRAMGIPVVWCENGFHYDPSIERVTGNVVLSGYFQSERYFSNVAPLIRSTLDLQTVLSPRGRDYRAQVAGDDSVSVHVRLGDYLSPTVSAVFTALGREYYARAIAVMTKLIGRVRLFVVSDDVEAAKNFFETGHQATFVEGTSHFDDLGVISACRHHVLANSTFSWWGAWLDGRPDGIVVAPREWFTRAGALKRNTVDLFPKHWLLA